MIPQIRMKMVANKLLVHLPTALAAGLLLFTLGYHIAQANTVSGSKVSATDDSLEPLPPPSSSIPELAQTELQQLLRTPVFGRVAKVNPAVKQASVVKAPKELPKTRLQLSLSGVVAKDDQSKGHAIINNQEYRVGETVVQGAKLHAVYTDRVVLEHRNKLEVLPLPDTDTSNNGRLGNNRNQFRQKNLAKRAKNKNTKE